MATALESADHATLVTLSRAGIVVRSVHRSMSTGAVARSGRSSGGVMSESVSLARGACAHPKRAMASTKKYARPFPLLTCLIRDADHLIGNSDAGIEVKRYSSDRASDALRAGRSRAHHEDKDGAEHQMDEESSRGLTRKVADHDLVAVDEKLERLHDHVTDKKSTQHLSGRVPRHPVDDAEADERRPDVTREDLRCDRSREAKPRQHRLGRYEQREPEDDSGDAADHEGEARGHGPESRSRK